MRLWKTQQKDRQTEKTGESHKIKKFSMENRGSLI